MIYHDTVTDELKSALKQGNDKINSILESPIVVSVAEQIAPFEPLEIIEPRARMPNVPCGT